MFFQKKDIVIANSSPKEPSQSVPERPRLNKRRQSSSLIIDFILMRSKTCKAHHYEDEDDVDCASSTFQGSELSNKLNKEALISEQPQIPEPPARRASRVSLSDNSNHSFTDETSEAAGIARAVQMLNLDSDESITSTHLTWFIVSVMCQGRMFLTNKAVYFHANLPYLSSEMIKSGILRMKQKGTLHSSYVKYWFMLRQDSFSYNTSSNNSINVEGTIDLNTASYVRLSTKDPRKFILAAEDRSYVFKADSHNSAHEWCKKLTREIFRLRNSGRHIRVRIPLANIAEVDRKIVIPETNIELLVLNTITESGAPGRQFFFGLFYDAQHTVESFKAWLQQVNEAQGYIFRGDGSMDLEQSSISRGKAGIIEDTTYHIPRCEAEASPYEMFQERMGSANIPGESIFHDDSPAMTPDFNTPLASPRAQSPAISRTNSSNNIPVLGAINKAIKSVVSDHNPLKLVQDHSSLSGEGLALSTPVESIEPKSHEMDSKPKVTKILSDDGTLKINLDLNLHTQDTRRSDPGTPLADEVDISSEEFRRIFNFGHFVELIQGFLCYIYRNRTPYFGRLFVADEYLCFQRLNSSGKPPSESHDVFIIIPWGDVEYTHMVPAESVSRQGYYGVEVSLGSAETFQLQFRSKRKAKAFLDSKKEAAEIRAIKHYEFMGTYANAEQETLFSIRVARLNTYEQAISQRMNIEIPPVVLDPSIKGGREPFLSQPMSKLKITMLTIGSRGDVQPYIALSQGLMAEGHTCRICSHGEYREWVESYGIEFKEIAGDPKALMEIMIEHGGFSYAFLKEATQKFSGWLDELLTSAWVACQGSDILIESPSAMAGLHIAEALKIPYFRAFTMPWTRTRAYPHAFIVPDGRHGGGYNYMTYVLFEKMLWLGIGSHVNTWRKNILNLPNTSLQQMRQQDVPFLYCVSPQILPPTMDQPDWVHVTGYWNIKDDQMNFTPEEGLVKFIHKARRDNVPIVYIGFGSIVVQDPAAMSKAVIQGVEKAKVRAVLAKGWSSRGSKETDNTKFPPDIYRIDQAPHDWLFPQMDAAVHHGGSGTTGMSLTCGIPTIIKPFFGDQNFYSHRVEELGVGIRLQKLNANSLAKALIEATTNHDMKLRAKSLGESLCHDHGVGNAIATIYQELPYANSRAGILTSEGKLHPTNTTESGTNTPARYDDDEHDEFEKVDEEFANIVKKAGTGRSWKFPALWNSKKSVNSSTHASRHNSPQLGPKNPQDTVTPVHSTTTTPGN